jgi:hypothetical protein
MPHRLRRRPSPALVVALLALFVALDGPATAAHLIDGRSIKRNSITTGQVRNKTLGTQDLSPTAIAALKQTPRNSVSTASIRAKAVDGSKLADGAVGAGALAPKAVDGTKLGDGAVGTVQLGAGSVTPSKIADSAIGSTAIADGSLQGPDVGDFFGSVIVDFAPFRLNECQTAEVSSPTPTGNAQAQIADDVILVTPAAGFSDLITVTANPGVGNTLRLIACRVGKDRMDPDNPNNIVDPIPTRFYYLGIDAP